MLAGQNARKLVINAVLKTGFSFDTLQTPPNGPVCEIVDRTVAFFWRPSSRTGTRASRPSPIHSMSQAVPTPLETEIGSQLIRLITKVEAKAQPRL